MHQGWPLERQDFSTEVISITFPADELIGSAVTSIDTAVTIIDDVINEADEFFIVVLTLSNENATDPSKVRLQESSVVKIVDNDGE